MHGMDTTRHYDAHAIIEHLKSAVDFHDPIWSKQHVQFLRLVVRDPDLDGNALSRIIHGLSTRAEERLANTLPATYRKLYNRNKRLGAENLQQAIKFHHGSDSTAHRIEVLDLFQKATKTGFVDEALRQSSKSLRKAQSGMGSDNHLELLGLASASFVSVHVHSVYALRFQSGTFFGS